MKILKLIKNNIIGIVVGFVIAGSITAGAVTMFASSDVSYDNSNSGASATTVKKALDELYEKAPEYYNPYAVGTPIYYNPVSGSKCFDYVSDNSLNNNKGQTTATQCMKWYIIGEATDTIDMILDHNTTKNVKWHSTADSSTGPSTILTQIHTDTDGWTGVPERTDTYTDPAYGYTIDYSGYRARLIEANELAKITGADKALQWDSAKEFATDSPTIGTNISRYYLDGKYGTDSDWITKVATSQGASKYAWLYDYTGYSSSDLCTSHGCNIGDTSGYYGYWTSSASNGSSERAWFVYYKGYLSHTHVPYADSGLRPVITIPKP